METETSILFEEFIYYIADKLNYEVKITEYSVYFYTEEYDKHFGIMNMEYICNFEYDSTKKFYCKNFNSDIMNKKISNNYYEDFLLDFYNIFKK